MTSRRFSYGIPDAWYAETIEAGIDSADLGKPDYEKAREQHDGYIGALGRCGLEITALEAGQLGCLSLRLVGGES